MENRYRTYPFINSYTVSLLDFRSPFMLLSYARARAEQMQSASEEPEYSKINQLRWKKKFLLPQASPQTLAPSVILTQAKFAKVRAVQCLVWSHGLVSFGLC